MTIDTALRQAAQRTRDDLGEGTNYPDVRQLLGFVEAAIAEQDRVMERVNAPIPTLNEQFTALTLKYPKATMEAGEHGYHLVTLPEFPLPEGYDRSSCTVYFAVPAGYPYAVPERFFTDSVRRVNGGVPNYARQLTNGPSHRETMGSFPAPKGGMIWFWKVQSWDVRRDTLKTYAAVIKSRLNRPAAGDCPHDWDD